jgi:hypothetical protein
MTLQRDQQAASSRPPQPPAIFPKRRAVPPMQWPPQNHDVMALIATICITAVLWE